MAGSLTFKEIVSVNEHLSDVVRFGLLEAMLTPQRSTPLLPPHSAVGVGDYPVRLKLDNQRRQMVRFVFEEHVVRLHEIANRLSIGSGASAGDDQIRLCLAVLYELRLDMAWYGSAVDSYSRQMESLAMNTLKLKTCLLLAALHVAVELQTGKPSPLFDNVPEV